MVNFAFAVMFFSSLIFYQIDLTKAIDESLSK